MGVSPPTSSGPNPTKTHGEPWLVRTSLWRRCAVEEYIRREMRAQPKLIMRIDWLRVRAFVGSCHVLGVDGASNGVPNILVGRPAERVRELRKLLGALQAQVLEVDGSVLVQ